MKHQIAESRVKLWVRSGRSAMKGTLQVNKKTRPRQKNMDSNEEQQWDAEVLYPYIHGSVFL